MKGEKQTAIDMFLQPQIHFNDYIYCTCVSTDQLGSSITHLFLFLTTYVHSYVSAHSSSPK